MSITENVTDNGAKYTFHIGCYIYIKIAVLPTYHKNIFCTTVTLI